MTQARARARAKSSAPSARASAPSCWTAFVVAARRGFTYGTPIQSTVTCLYESAVASADGCSAAAHHRGQTHRRTRSRPGGLALHKGVQHLGVGLEREPGRRRSRRFGGGSRGHGCRCRPSRKGSRISPHGRKDPLLHDVPSMNHQRRAKFLSAPIPIPITSVVYFGLYFPPPSCFFLLRGGLNFPVFFSRKITSNFCKTFRRETSTRAEPRGNP